MAIDFNKLCALILLGTVLYNEYLAYYLSYLAWPHVPDPGPEGAVILLVADPQIQGRAHEPGGLQGAVQRWDSDRFLHKSYSWVMAGYSTSATVFLGDLVDEGSETTDRELYQEYAQRFHAIYPKYSEDQKMVFLPGDNDIGGEGSDLVTLDKIVMFNQHFGPTELVYSVSEKVDIVPVSRLTEQGQYNLTLKPDKLDRSKVVVAVSHVPVLPLNGRFAERVMDLVNPDLIFSAHDHHGYLFTANRQSRKLARDVEKFSSQVDNTPLALQTRDSDHQPSSLVWEVVVPTCSYRMGVKEIGLGLAVVGTDGEVTYTNLWLPSRFSLLYTYLASLVVVVVIVVVKKGVEIRRLVRRRKDTQGVVRAKYQPMLGY